MKINLECVKEMLQMLINKPGFPSEDLNPSC